MTFNQAEYDIRCEWGENGVAALASDCNALIIVDILSFTTCVEIATARGVTVYPYRWKDSSSQRFASEIDAELATPRDAGGFSLSPASLTDIPSGSRLVLPSPNGSKLSLATGNVPTFAGCFRNAAAVANTARELGNVIGIVPAGERWPDGSLRPSLEDLLGAGALIEHLAGSMSPEAQTAQDAFRAARPRLKERIMRSVSGNELIERGYERDVHLASEVNVSQCVPRLHGGAYINVRDLGPKD